MTPNDTTPNDTASDDAQDDDTLEDAASGASPDDTQNDATPDDAQDGPEPTAEPPIDCRCLRLEDGDVIVYGPENPREWVQSDVAVPLPEVS